MSSTQLSKINFLLDSIDTGYAILAEISRLAELVPDDFKNPEKSRYQPFIIDFSYFENLSVIDTYLDSNELGAQLEDEYMYKYEKLILEFGTLFDTIAQFLSDLVEYSNDQRSLSLVQLTIRTQIFSKYRQQEAEVVFVAGLILICLEEKFTPAVRQRLFVAHYRINSSNAEHYGLLIDVLRASANREELFRRLALNRDFSNGIVSALRTDHVVIDQDERILLSSSETEAYRAQRAFISICLFFTPQILHSDKGAMSQIVDAYFTHQWVIPLHMGMIINLVDAWDRFRAASNALQQSLSVNIAKELIVERVSSLCSVNFPRMTKLSITDVISLASIFAKSNRNLEWIMLHSYRNKSEKICKRATLLWDCVTNQLNSYSFSVFEMLQRIAIFEYDYKEIRLKLTRKLVSNKKDDVRKLKNEIFEHIMQVANLFTNELPVQKIRRNENLGSWLELLGSKIIEIDVNEVQTLSLISEISARLEQVTEIHNLSSIAVVSQILHAVQSLLNKLSHFCALDDQFLARVESFTDFSSAWMIIDQWTEKMQNLVKKDPLPVCSVFVKLANSMKTTVQRSCTVHRISVIQLCYSYQLETRLRQILQVVPRSLFSSLERMSQLLSPPQEFSVYKTEIRKMIDSDRRLQLAEITHSISTLSSGITTMRLSSLGSVKVDPSTLLQDGIRRQLAIHICTTLQTQTTSDCSMNELLDRLKEQFTRLRGAFVYMCEHIALNGALIWHTELAYAILFMVDKECSSFSGSPITMEQSTLQMQLTSSMKLWSADGSATPLHRLYYRILDASDPRNTYYVNSLQIWCDLRSKKVLLANDSFDNIQKALSPIALWALDRMCAFHIVKQLYSLCDHVASLSASTVLSMLGELEAMKTITAVQRSKLLENGIAKFQTISMRFVSTISNIGHLQLLRQRIVDVNFTMLRQQSAILSSAISTLNDALLHNVHAGIDDCERLLSEMSILAERSVPSNCFLKYYIKKEAPKCLASAMLLTLFCAGPKFNVPKKPDSTDITAFCAGLATTLFQFDSINAFFALYGLCKSTVVLTRVTSKQPSNVSIAAAMVARQCSLKDFEEIYASGEL